jgi:hypothetical protein
MPGPRARALDGVAVSAFRADGAGMRKVPPPSGQVTGRKPGAGDRWLWNRNETAHSDR